MLGVDTIIGYFITGIIWGSTNAFMEVGSKEDESEKTENKNELKEGAKMFAKLGFLIPFLIN